MVKLQLLIAPYVTGYLHIQTNPKLSYSQTATVKNAERRATLLDATEKNKANIRVKELLPYFKDWHLILTSNVSVSRYPQHGKVSVRVAFWKQKV
jgi:hypothetical protein